MPTYISNILFSQFLGFISPILLILFGSNQMSPIQHGELRYLLTLLPILAFFTLPGIDTLILINCSKNKNVDLFSAFRMKFLFGCVGGLFILTLALLNIGDNIGINLKLGLLLTAMLLPFHDTALIYKNYLIGLGLESVAVNNYIYNQIFSIILFVIAIFIVTFSKINNIYIFPLWLLSNSIPSLIFFYKIQNRQSKINKFNIKFSDALVISFTGIIGTLIYVLDKIFLQNALGPEFLAYYSCLVIVPQEFAKLINTFIIYFYRKIVKNTFISIKNLPLKFYFYSALGLALYIFIFKYTSQNIFGSFYQYDLSTVFLSSLNLFGLSLEFYFFNHVLIKYGKNSQLLFFLFNLLITFGLLYMAVKIGNINTILFFLLVKQLVCPLIGNFYFRYKK
jgi:hypothetical protein